MRAACLAPDGSRLLPRTPSQLGAALFGEALPESERDEAAEGVLACLCAARSASGSAPLPLRSHLFFRSLQGLWACTNPQCSELADRTQPCPVGALHYQPTLSCRCGSRVLELLACECCGEVFLGGYRSLDTQNPGEWFLIADHPDLEASPETAFLNRDFQSYAVFWPAAESLRPITPQWDQDRVTRRWDAAALDTKEGKVVLGGSEGVTGFLYNVRNPTASANPYPAICPRCDEDRRRRRLDTPLRVIRTGFQKLAQVLSDGLLATCRKPRPDRTASLLSSPTAGRMPLSCPPECDSRTIAMPFASRSRRPSRPRDVARWPFATRSRDNNSTRSECGLRSNLWRHTRRKRIFSIAPQQRSRQPSCPGY